MPRSSKIGVITATIIGMNAMIGAGIFSTPSKLLSFVGPAGILTYSFVVLAVWCMASSFGRLGYLFPAEGSFYAYARQWGGHSIGLIASGSYLLGVIIGMGLLLQLAGIYLHDYLPTASPYALGILALMLLVLVTMVGGRATRALQIITLCCTTLPILIITAMCLSKASLANLTPFAPYGFGHVLRATQAVIFGFFGFESVASLFAIVENPRRTVPRALGYAILLVSSIYFLFIFSIMLAVPSTSIADPTVPLSHLLTDLFPAQTWLIGALHFSITASFLSVLNAMLFATSNLFTSLLATIGKQTRSLLPHRNFATLIMGLLIATSYSILHDIDLFFNFTALFVIAAYILALISLFTVRQSLWQTVQTITGLGTAAVIIFFAVEGILGRFL